MTAVATAPKPRTLQSRRGAVVHTTLTDAEALLICGNMNDSFANDLAQKAARQTPSSEQWYWLHKKAMEEVAPAAPQAPQAPIANDLQPVRDLFRKAAQHLKHPKINLLAGDQPVQIMVAGPNSRYKGDIMVTDGERYPCNKFFGRINQCGVFVPGREQADEVTTLLTLFAADPAGTAAQYGKLTGQCCFCRKDLSDPRSTAVGYGKTCADHYGLPW